MVAVFGCESKKLEFVGFGEQRDDVAGEDEGEGVWCWVWV